MNGSGAKATEMVVQVTPGVVPRPGRTDSRGEFGRHADGHQGFEGLVNGGQTDPGNRLADRLIDILGRGMVGGLDQNVVDGKPLRSSP